MSKRILAMLLSVVLVLGCMPSVVFAEEAPETAYVCEHCDQTPEWVAWDGTTAMESGKHYQLTAETLKPDATIALTEGSFVLDLMGHTIDGSTAKQIFGLSGTAELTLLDSTAKEEEGVYTAGKLTGATDSAILVKDKATLNIYDGIFQGNKAATYGGVIRLYSGEGTVNIFGGLFTENSTKYGGAIYTVGDRTKQWRVHLNIENAKFTNNSSSTAGAIFCEGLTTLYMKDTEVTGNSTTSSNSGGMYLTSAEGEATFAGRIVIDDNTNKSGSNGRNLHVNNAAIVLKLDGLTEGSCINMTGKSTNPAAVLNIVNQTEWCCNWVTLAGESLSWVDADADGVVAASELVAGHYHDGVQYTAITSATEIPTTGGNFYLTQDVKRSAVTAFGKNTNLCLNGHDIISTGTSRLIQTTKNTGAELTIEDCSAYTDENGVYQAGAITGANFSSSGAVYINAGTTFILRGGKISGNTAQAAAGVYNVGTFYMYGGEVSGNKATNATSGAHGGGIYNNGVFRMEGGVVAGNVANNYGGGIYALKDCTISGGLITGNSAAQGGGVALYKGVNEIGAVTITGNSTSQEGGGLWLSSAATATLNGTIITDNTTTGADKGGGGVAAREKSKLTIVSAEICNNHADNGQGGGIFAVSAETEVTIEGGLISGNTAKFGGAALTSTEAKLTLKGGTIEKNVAAAQAGGIYVSTNTNFYMEGGLITGNTAKRLGGGIYCLNSAVTITGGTISNNSSEEAGGGIALSTNGQPVLNLQGGTITGNIGPTAGGIYTAENCTLNISGNPQVMANLAGGKASNLDLGGVVVMNVGEMTEGAQIGISGQPFRAISQVLAADCSAAFTSDGTPLYAVKLVDGALFLDLAVEHNHCICAGTSTQGCDHSQLKFIPWDNETSLPTSGNYYLMTDVEVSAQTRLENTELNLCLNGHTIKVKETGRVFYLADNAKLSITDCIGGGKLTGATAGAILTNGSGNAMEINLYAGEITENHSTDTGGAIVIQADVVLNMYGGKITNNSVPANKYGGALYVGNRATFKMYGGEISGNSALSGGGIYAYQGSLELLGGKISGNTATENGGGVYGKTNAQLLLKGTVVEGNTATKDGGGIYVNEGAALTIQEGTLITKNIAESTGGGVAISGEGVQLTMEGGTISENTAKHGGGVITLSKSQLILKGGSIEKNAVTKQGGGVYVSTGTQLIMEGGKIAENQAEDNGGGIYNLRSTTTITGGSVENNVSKVNGGALATSSSCTVTISNATISGNYAENYGGALAMLGSVTKNSAGETVISVATAQLLEGAVITGNSVGAKGTGGGFFVTGQDSSVLIDGATISKNTAKYGGGGICQSKSSITMKSGKVADNTATTNGGGLYISTKTDLYMQGGTISGNYSKASGGGIYFLTSTMHMSGGSVTGNTAKVDGGGWYMQRGDSDITGGSVTNNQAVNGGGFRVTAGKHRISGLTVSYNTATEGGGGIYAGRQMVKENGVNVDKLPDFVINGITLVGNKTKSGGGMLLVSKGAEYTIRNAYIAENNATSGGGGIYISTGATLNLSDSTLTKNYGRTGGALQHLSSTGHYENVVVSENTGNNAAAMNVTKKGAVTIKNVKFLNNVGSASGAVVIQGSSTGTAENCEFTGNSSEKTGGGIWITTKAVVEISNSQFKDNKAVEDAGGVMLGMNTKLTMDGCSFEGNHAGRNGGGIYNRGLMYLNNSTLTGNTCGNNGAGIGSGKTGSTHTGDYCGLYIENVTSSGNAAEGNGGGLFGSLGCHVVAKNLTLTDNVAAKGAGSWTQEDFLVENLTATGNRSTEGGAVYLAASHYDGQSYFSNINRFIGDVVVKDNEGGGVFVGELTTLTLAGEALSQNSYLDVTLHSGLLGQKVFGVYNYEGENPTFVLTAGDRSVTDPELPVYEAPEPEQTQPTETETETQAPTEPAAAEQTDTMLYVAIGGIAAVILLAAAVLVIVKKKKSAKAEKN